MDALIRFHFTADRQHGNEQDQGLGVGKGGAAGTMASRFGELRVTQKLIEFLLTLLDPRRVELADGGWSG